MNKQWVSLTIFGLWMNFLLVERVAGISIFLLIATYVGVIGYLRYQEGTLDRIFYFIGAYMILLAPVFMVTTVPVIRFFAGLVLCLLSILLVISPKLFRWQEWLKSLIVNLVYGLGNGIEYFRAGRRGAGIKSKYLGQIILGLVIAIPLLSVAIVLLSSADAIMAQMTEDFIEEIQWDGMDVLIFRIILFVVTVPLLFGMFVHINRKDADQEIEAISEPQSMKFIPTLVSATVLVSLNLVYVFFAYIQIRFLFLAGNPAFMEGYHYADYARRGFFELVILAVFNIMGILVIHGFTKPHIFIRISLSITAMSTMIMLVSSAYKMRLYEVAYGYTQLRLYVYFILAFMALFMIMIGYGIWKEKARVIEWAVVIGLVYFLCVSYLNVDRIIVDNNLERFEEEGGVDLYYLTSLSEDGRMVLMAYDQKGDMLKSAKDYDHFLTMKERWVEEATSQTNRDFLSYNIRYSAYFKSLNTHTSNMN